MDIETFLGIFGCIASLIGYGLMRYARKNVKLTYKDQRVVVQK